jgi:hypothetical protein
VHHRRSFTRAGAALFRASATLVSRWPRTVLSPKQVIVMPGGAGTHGTEAASGFVTERPITARLEAFAPSDGNCGSDFE